MAVFTRANPVLANRRGTIDQYNAVFENTIALLQGDQPFDAFSLNIEDSVSTGTVNNFNLDALATAPKTGVGYLRFMNSSSLTLTGMTGGREGRVVPFMVYDAPLHLLNENAASSSSNRFVTEARAADARQVIGKGGWGLLIYDIVNARWYVHLGSPGAPITQSYTAGDYFATGGGSPGWTVDAGDVSTHQYIQYGKRVTIKVTIATSTISGTPTALRINMPIGWLATKRSGVVGQITIGGTATEGCAVFAPSGLAYIQVERFGGIGMGPSGSNNSSLEFTLPDVEIT